MLTVQKGALHPRVPNLFWMMLSVMGVLLSLYAVIPLLIRKRDGGELEMFVGFL